MLKRLLQWILCKFNQPTYSSLEEFTCASCGKHHGVAFVYPSRQQFENTGENLVGGFVNGIVSETSILYRVAKSLQFCPKCRRVYSNDEWRVNCPDCKAACVDMLTEDEIIFLHNT